MQSIKFWPDTYPETLAGGRSAWSSCTEREQLHFSNCGSHRPARRAIYWCSEPPSCAGLQSRFLRPARCRPDPPNGVYLEQAGINLVTGTIHRFTSLVSTRVLASTSPHWSRVSMGSFLVGLSNPSTSANRIIVEKNRRTEIWTQSSAFSSSLIRTFPFNLIFSFGWTDDESADDVRNLTFGFHPRYSCGVYFVVG